MSQTELLRTQLDSARREVQLLEVKNRWLQESRLEEAERLDAQTAEEKTLREKVQNLTTKVADLRVQLHEAQENEAKATEDMGEARNQMQRIETDQTQKDSELVDTTARLLESEQKCNLLTMEIEKLKQERRQSVTASNDRCREQSRGVPNWQQSRGVPNWQQSRSARN